MACCSNVTWVILLQICTKTSFQATITKLVKKLLYHYKKNNKLTNKLYYTIQHNTLIYTMYIQTDRQTDRHDIHADNCFGC